MKKNTIFAERKSIYIEITENIDMTKRFLALLVMLCIAIPAMAQSVKITAKIVDAETKEGIIGAIMEVIDPKTDKRRHSV